MKTEHCSDRDISNMIMMELLDMKNMDMASSHPSARIPDHSEPDLSPTQKNNSFIDIDDSELSKIIIKQIKSREHANTATCAKKRCFKRKKHEGESKFKKDYTFVNCNNMSPSCNQPRKEFVFVDCDPTKPIIKKKTMVQRSKLAKKIRDHDAFVTHFVLE
ncbi:menD [Acrasis kona]|uniref:MenD n=1 Tax=Acrasis kona TaxID=1008807 RepID=A0AAW2Z4D9_9EUKA